jgi:hypothetical protein
MLCLGAHWNSTTTPPRVARRCCDWIDYGSGVAGANGGTSSNVGNGLSDMRRLDRKAEIVVGGLKDGESRVRALLIELFDKAVELGLLLEEVAANRVRRRHHVPHISIWSVADSQKWKVRFTILRHCSKLLWWQIKYM